MAWPAVSVNDKFLITIFGTVCDQRTITTFWYRVNSITGAAAPNIDVFSDAVDIGVTWSAMLAAYKDCFPNNGTIDQTRIQFIAPIRYTARKYVEGVNGTSGYDAMTANVAATITRQSLIADRRNVSRITIPTPENTDWMDGGKFVGDALTNLGVLATKMKLSIVEVIAGATVTCVPVQVWRTPVTGVIASRDLDTTTVQETVRVMRRRTYGKGV